MVFDKDDVLNCYTEEYLYSLASAGDIQLVGIVTSTSVAPHNSWVSPDDYDRFVALRKELVQKARRSGFHNLPDPVRGPRTSLARPASGRVEDTVPLETDGSRLIIEEGLKATPERPLVLVLCGPLTVAANAVLLEPRISDRVVAAWFGGSHVDMADYNGWADAWAAHVVLRRLQLVQFPARKRGGDFSTSPVVPKARLRELPETELRAWMIAKQHPNGQPGSVDADAPPAISLSRPDYVLGVRRVSPGGGVSFSLGEERDLPAFRDDPLGRALVVERASRATATEEWWRALGNPEAYHSEGAG